MTELPKRIWIYQTGDGVGDVYGIWAVDKTYDTDTKYYRADRYHACIEAGCSLNYHLFELTNALLNRPDIGEREIADMLDDAQPALDKWNRFLDGKEE